MMKKSNVALHCILAGWLGPIPLLSAGSMSAIPPRSAIPVETTASTDTVGLHCCRGSHPPLDLVLLTGAGLPDGISRSLRTEIDRLFEDTAVDISVQIHEGPAADLPTGEHPSVRVRLWPRDGAIYGLDPSIMGAVRLKQGHVVESVHVFLPVVIATLLRSGETEADLTDLEIGRALGRVVAHELIHAVSPRSRHGGSRLMRHGLDRESLRSLRPLGLERGSATAFARGLTALAQQSERASRQ